MIQVASLDLDVARPASAQDEPSDQHGQPKRQANRGGLWSIGGNWYHSPNLKIVSDFEISNAERALDEFVRVVRSGGEIIITTRLGAERGLRGAIEKTLMPS